MKQMHSMCTAHKPLIAACPPQQRRAFAMVAAVTLFSASSLLL